jgi:ATP-dependent helicase/nuclease subunit A
LREKADCREKAWGEVEYDTAPWQFYLWNPYKIEAVVRKENLDYRKKLAQVKELLPVECDAEGLKVVVARLNWAYPYQELTAIPGKLSVSEIKNRYRLLAGEQEASQQFFTAHRFASRPQFLQRKGLSASEKGSALHLVMRYLKLEKAIGTAEVEQQIKEMVKRELLTSLQAEAVKPEEIVKFVHSPLGERIGKGRELQREVPFTLALPAEEFYPEAVNIAGEIIILQGTIDCIFKEGEEYVLVDYKSDKVNSGDINVLRERYRLQMELYAQAVRTIFAQPIKEKILYSFSLQEYISV